MIKYFIESRISLRNSNMKNKNRKDYKGKPEFKDLIIPGLRIRESWNPRI